MHYRNSLLFSLLILAFPGSQNRADPAGKSPLTSSSHPDPPTSEAALRQRGRLPLSFERNQGQTNASVRFLSHAGDGDTLFLTPSEAVFRMNAPGQGRREGGLSEGNAPKRPEKAVLTVLRMRMVGADPQAGSLAQPPLAGRINYFIGNDSRRWHVGVPTYGRVGFHSVYPGVDLVYYGNQQRLEYDFVVAPHADPNRIRLHFAGASSVRVNRAGDLIVRTQGRELTWQKPTVYQEGAAGRHLVPASFRLRKRSDSSPILSFVLGSYDAGRPLVIDPVLLYSTYLGGNGKLTNAGPSGADRANAVAVDSAGAAYLTGLAGSSDFPTTAGAFQTASSDQYSVFVTKLNPTGTALIYSTILGGNRSEMPSSIALDSQGNAYVTGYTQSADFPTTPGAFQTTGQEGVATPFVAKLNTTGMALIYSTYLGTKGTGNGIVVDGSGNAYVAGYTTDRQFPTTTGAFQPTTRKSSGDTTSKSAFVTKIDRVGATLVYSTFLEGSARDSIARGIALDGSGNAYVAGDTGATDFPTTPGAFQTVDRAATPTTAYNGFVTKLNTTGSAPVYSTYLGGSGIPGQGADTISALAVDSSGNAYVGGGSVSSDFPLTSGAFESTVSTIASPVQNGFVTKLNAAGTALVYSTFLGGNEGCFVSGIAVDGAGNACVTGTTTSKDLPTTPGAFQHTKTSGVFNVDGFVAKLNATGDHRIYASLLNGTSTAYCAGIALDSSGNLYVVGSTFSNDFPVTPGAFQTTNHAVAADSSKTNAFATKLPSVPIFPDLNNDGHTDLLFQNVATNAIASWFINGSTWLGGAYFSSTPPGEYTLVGVGDFSGTGGVALVLQSRVTGQVVFWYAGDTNYATVFGGDFVNTLPEAGWKVVGVGDFNGDTKSDLVFQNQTTGQIAIWFMKGPIRTGGVVLPHTPLAGWKMVGAGDLDADGWPDLIFQNQSTRQIALWMLQGTTYVGGMVLPSIPQAGWSVAAVGDYNGDGCADLLFQNQTSNRAAVWYLKNGIRQGGEILSIATPAGWKIVGPR